MGTELTSPVDVLQAIATGDIEAMQDRKAIALSVVESILRAESEAEAFDAGGTIATRELVGVRLELRDVKLMPGEIEDAALPVYVLLDCRDEAGGRMVVNSGAARVIGQAVFAKINNLLPKWVTVVEVAKAKPGQSAPLGLSVV